MAHNDLLYATLRVANRATRNVGERRRGNEGAQRPTDLAVVNPGAPAQGAERIQRVTRRASFAYNFIVSNIFLKYFCFKFSLNINAIPELYSKIYFILSLVLFLLCNNFLYK